MKIICDWCEIETATVKVKSCDLCDKCNQGIKELQEVLSSKKVKDAIKAFNDSKQIGKVIMH